MVIMAASCVGQRDDYSSISMSTPDLIDLLKQKQSPDGSFNGNVISSALAVQAMMTAGSADDSVDSAKRWLRSVQLGDGSFGDLLSTTEAAIALSPAKLGPNSNSNSNSNNIRLRRCPSVEAMASDSDSDIAEADNVANETIAVHLMTRIGRPVQDESVVQLDVGANTTACRLLEMAAERRADLFEYSSVVHFIDK